MKYHHLPIVMFKMEKTDHPHATRDLKELEVPHIARGTEKWFEDFGKSSGSTLKTSTHIYHVTQSFHNLVFA